VNQEGEFWKIMFSIYHGCWVYDNKGDGLLVNLDTASADDLTVASEAGTAAVGDSVITVSGVAPAGFKYVWKAASGTAPSVAIGTALKASDGWADLPAGGLISTTNAYKITVALVAANGQPIAYGTGTVAAKTA
jgi:hypothetical protein